MIFRLPPYIPKRFFLQVMESFARPILHVDTGRREVPLSAHGRGLGCSPKQGPGAEPLVGASGAKPPVSRGLGRCLQRGPGAEPLVGGEGAKPPDFF